MIFAPLAAAAAAVFLYLFLRRSPRALVVFVWQKIGNAPNGSRLKKEWTLPEDIRRVLDYTSKCGFTSVSLKDLARPAKLPAKPVLFAFIGGYQSFYTEVFPLLKERNLHAAVFLTPETAGQYNSEQNPYDEPWQDMMTPRELKELAKSGFVSFGALGLNAEDLTRMPQEEASFSAQESLFRLETQLGLKAEGFAFWPAKYFDGKKAAEILGGKNQLPVIAPFPGVNPAGTILPFLKTIQPGCRPLLARYILWKQK